MPEPIPSASAPHNEEPNEPDLFNSALAVAGLFNALSIAQEIKAEQKVRSHVPTPSLTQVSNTSGQGLISRAARMIPSGNTFSHFFSDLMTHYAKGMSLIAIAAILAYCIKEMQRMNREIDEAEN